MQGRANQKLFLIHLVLPLYQLAMHVVPNGRAHFGIYPYKAHFGIYPYEDHFGIHPLRYLPHICAPTSVFTHFGIYPFIHPDEGLRG